MYNFIARLDPGDLVSIWVIADTAFIEIVFIEDKESPKKLKLNKPQTRSDFDWFDSRIDEFLTNNNRGYK